VDVRLNEGVLVGGGRGGAGRLRERIDGEVQRRRACSRGREEGDCGGPYGPMRAGEAEAVRRCACSRDGDSTYAFSPWVRTDEDVGPVADRQKRYNTSCLLLQVSESRLRVERVGKGQRRREAGKEVV
jgi:hypothetical protein